MKPEDMYLKFSQTQKQEAKENLVQEPGATLKQYDSKRTVLKQRNTDDLDSGGKKKRVKQKIK